MKTIIYSLLLPIVIFINALAFYLFYNILLTYMFPSLEFIPYLWFVGFTLAVAFIKSYFPNKVLDSYDILIKFVVKLMYIVIFYIFGLFI